jgi:hypothetical protein
VGIVAAGVEVRTNVEIITRTQFLGRLMLELLEDLSDSHNDEEIEYVIQKGILENQIIGGFKVEYIKDEKSLGEVTIEIDWNRHLVNIDKFGEKVTYDLDKTAQKQVSEAIAVLVTYIEQFRKKNNAQSRLLWWWRKGVNSEEATNLIESQKAEQMERHSEGEIKQLTVQISRGVDSEKTESGRQQAEGIKHGFTLRPRKYDEILIDGWVIDMSISKRKSVSEKEDDVSITDKRPLDVKQIDPRVLQKKLYQLAREIISDITGKEVNTNVVAYPHKSFTLIGKTGEQLTSWCSIEIHLEFGKMILKCDDEFTIHLLDDSSRTISDKIFRFIEQAHTKNFTFVKISRN